MDLNEILEIILENNNNGWNFLVLQVCFYCFRAFIAERIAILIELPKDETLDIPWTNLQELTKQYCDENWKPYIHEFFIPESPFEDDELLEIFFRNFVESLDVLVKTNDTVNQDKFTDFLDIKLFEVFKDSIFPSSSFEGNLNIQKYFEVRTELFPIEIPTMEEVKEEEVKEEEVKEEVKEEEVKEEEKEEEGEDTIQRKSFANLNVTPIKKNIHKKTRTNKIILSHTRKNKHVSL